MSPAIRSRLPWRWLLVGGCVTVVLAVAAGLVVREVFANPTHAASAPTASVTSAPPQHEPGSGVVQAAPDVRNHPDSGPVLDVLQRQFDAINRGDYAMWTTTVVAGKLKDLPPAKWRSDYETTKDGSIVVHRIDPGPGGGVVVLVSFTSTQSTEKAPPDFAYPCIRWQMMYPIVQERGEPRVDAVRPANVLRSPCHR